ncbi:hypothetical protein CANCADRAFT_106700 [Tortispora caseinolytica NRRL Y-17796]|uniref:Uncharacterized protein n=1 Tax=Tortispora caseinolytica NRRL Y-17796 TaxID=767744 RepID=A0A1E4TFC4_9ASCO|nr:hypothetical protein CANCADRAFT_106700 [Tortispora caseinolytica NRRL Y-17796]
MILHPLILLPLIFAFPVVDNDLYKTSLGSSSVSVLADHVDESVTVNVRDRASKAEIHKHLRLHGRDVDSADNRVVDSADHPEGDSADYRVFNYLDKRNIDSADSLGDSEEEAYDPFNDESAGKDANSVDYRAVEYLDKHNINPAYKYDPDFNDNHDSDVEDDTYEFFPLHARRADTEEDPYRYIRSRTLHCTDTCKWTGVAEFLKEHPDFVKLAIDTMKRNANFKGSNGLLKDKLVKRTDHQTEQKPLLPYMIDSTEIYLPKKWFITGSSQLDAPHLTLTELSKAGFELDKRFGARILMQATPGAIQGFDTLFPGSGDRLVKIIYFDFPETASVSDECRADFTKCTDSSEISQAVNVSFVGGRLFGGKISLDFIPGARPASEPATRENALLKVQSNLLFHIATMELFDIYTHMSDYMDISDADKPTFLHLKSDLKFSLQAFDGNDVFAEYTLDTAGIGIHLRADGTIDPLVPDPEAKRDNTVNIPVQAALQLVNSMSEFYETRQSNLHNAPPNSPEDMHLNKRSPDPYINFCHPKLLKCRLYPEDEDCKYPS